MEIVCRKCAYRWDYKGSATRISCSKCKTSIMIHKEEEYSPPEPIPQKQTLTNKQVIEVKFPKTLWKDVRLSQRFYQIMKGDPEYVTLKVDSEGMLSL